MPVFLFPSRSPRTEAPPPEQVHLVLPEGSEAAEIRFWAAACAAVAGLRLVVEELPDDGRAPSSGRLTLCAPQDGARGQDGAAVEMWRDEGSGGETVRLTQLELPRDRDLLVQLLVEQAGTHGVGVGLVLCHPETGRRGRARQGVRDGRPGLAWSLARLLSAPGHGVAVHRASRRVHGLPEDPSLFTTDHLIQLLSTPAPGAVVVDVGADGELADLLLGSATLGVLLGTGRHAPEPPGPGWIGVGVRGRIGCGDAPEQWARHLRGRTALEFGAHVALAVERHQHQAPAPDAPGVEIEPVLRRDHREVRA